MTSSKPNHLPKVPPPNIITLGVSASTYKFWRHVDIQSITFSSLKLLVYKISRYAAKIGKDWPAMHKNMIVITGW